METRWNSYFESVWCLKIHLPFPFNKISHLYKTSSCVLTGRYVLNYFFLIFSSILGMWVLGVSYSSGGSLPESQCSACGVLLCRGQKSRSLSSKPPPYLSLLPSAPLLPSLHSLHRSRLGPETQHLRNLKKQKERKHPFSSPPWPWYIFSIHTACGHKINHYKWPDNTQGLMRLYYLTYFYQVWNWKIKSNPSQRISALLYVEERSRLSFTFKLFILNPALDTLRAGISNLKEKCRRIKRNTEI